MHRLHRKHFSLYMPVSKCAKTLGLGLFQRRVLHEDLKLFRSVREIESQLCYWLFVHPCNLPITS